MWEIHLSPGVTAQILLNMHFWLQLFFISVSLKASFKGSAGTLGCWAMGTVPAAGTVGSARELSWAGH